MPQNTDGYCCQNVQDGMLLHEYGGNTDQKFGNYNADLPGLGQLLTPQSRLHHRQVADHMDRRAHIGIGIELVESCNKADQKIVPCKSFGAKLLTGGPNQIGHDGNGIGQNDIFHHSCKTVSVI